MKRKFIKIMISIFCITFVVVFIFILGFSQIEGDSMMPNFENGRIITYSKMLNTYRRFDVVIVRVSGNTYLKRIIGLPNDNLKYKNDKLFINNTKIEESYKRTVTMDFSLKYRIPKNKYLVLGDNRSYSYDGRNFGLIDISDIKGKVLFKFF